MAERSDLVPIDRVTRLDSAQLEALRRAYITSAEALVGQLEADPEAVGVLLHLDSGELKELTAHTKTLLSAETRHEFSQRAGKRYSYGALNPHRD